MAKDLDYFMEHPDEFEGLSDENRMLLANGEAIEGEISGSSPDAEETTQKESQENSDEPIVGADDTSVVVAKDGVHTIPFEELQRARDEAKFWQAQAEAAKQQADKVQAPEGTTADQVDLKQLRRDLREATLIDDEQRIEDLESKIDAELARRAETTAIQVLERRNAEQAQFAEQAEIARTAEALVVKYPALDHTKPETANAEAIATVQTLSAMYAQQGRSSSQALVDAVGRVAKLFGFDAADDGVTDAAAKADKAIAAASAKAKVPSSLSSIPAAPTPPTDELQAVSQMSAQQIQDKMMDMPREKIMALLARQM